MSIKSIEFSREDFELTRPYTIAFRTVTHVSQVIVKIKTEKGLIGLGSGSPEPFVTGEKIEDSLEALEGFPLDDLKKFSFPGDLGKATKLVRDLLPKTPAAKAALDIALYDLASKTRELPLAKMLGQKKHSLPTSITIGIKSVDEALEEAKEYIERNFKVLKVKLGKNYDEDIERLVKLRELAGKDIAMRVDPNQGYDIPKLEKFFTDTASLNLEFVEQPIKMDRFHEMSQISPDLRKKVMADESLQSPKDAKDLTHPELLCGIFNIKLMKCGGVTPALEIAKIAEDNGVQLMWGCMDESRISIAAALHAAFASPATEYLDLDGHLDLNRDLVKGGFLLENGIMSLTDEPGLGCIEI